MPNPQIETTAYNYRGQTESVTDFKNQKTEFVYDTLGRAIEKNLYADGSTVADVEITMTYDNDGRQETIEDPRHGITQWHYDDRGRMHWLETPEGSVNYEYDPTTSQKTATHTDKSRTEYLYDDLGRLEFVKQTVRNGITLPTEEVTQYEYDDNGSRKSIIYANQVKTSYTYDLLGRLETLEHRDSGTSLLRKYAYALDTDGKRLGVVESHGPSQTLDPQLTINYQYDDLNRLIQEQSVIDNNPGGVIDTDRAFTHDYVYDTIGNRLSKAITGGETITYGYNNLNQLETESSSTASYSTAYNYDNNGAQTTMTRTGTDDETSTYGYSLDGRMDTSIINRDEDGADIEVTTGYTYNPSGIRTRAEQTTFKIDTVDKPLNNRKYLVDPTGGHTGYAQVLEESVGGTLTKTYTLGDDVLTQADGSAGGGVAQYLNYDGHGSTRLLTSAAGTIVKAFSFDAYGKSLVDTFGATNTPATTLLYAGEQLDPDIQRYYLRARYYNTDTGRFSREDPYSGRQLDPQSLHKYAYAHSNPVINTDPSGLFSLIELLVVIVVVAVVVGIILISNARKPNLLPPTATMLLNDPVVNPELRRTYRESNVGPAGTIPAPVEQGGYITTDNKGNFTVHRLPQGNQASLSFKVYTSGYINTGWFSSELIVGTFHTHPNTGLSPSGRQWDPSPSQADQDNFDNFPATFGDIHFVLSEPNVYIMDRLGPGGTTRITDIPSQGVIRP